MAPTVGCHLPCARAVRWAFAAGQEREARVELQRSGGEDAVHAAIQAVHLVCLAQEAVELRITQCGRRGNALQHCDALASVSATMMFPAASSVSPPNPPRLIVVSVRAYSREPGDAEVMEESTSTWEFCRMYMLPRVSRAIPTVSMAMPPVCLKLNSCVSGAAEVELMEANTRMHRPPASGT
jgi:hypothetical protein